MLLLWFISYCCSRLFQALHLWLAFKTYSCLSLVFVLLVTQLIKLQTIMLFVESEGHMIIFKHEVLGGYKIVEN